MTSGELKTATGKLERYLQAMCRAFTPMCGNIVRDYKFRLASDAQTASLSDRDLQINGLFELMPDEKVRAALNGEDVFICVIDVPCFADWMYLDFHYNPIDCEELQDRINERFNVRIIPLCRQQRGNVKWFPYQFLVVARDLDRIIEEFPYGPI